MKNVLVCVGLVENRVAIKLCRPVLILREKLATLRVQQTMPTVDSGVPKRQSVLLIIE